MLDATDEGRDQGGELDPTDAFLLSLFARIDTVAFATAAAAVASLTMFIATIALLIKGASPGYHIGPNLGSLSTFWPGYSVSWGGSIIGGAYAAVFGGIVGFALAIFWNFTQLVIVGLAALRVPPIGSD